MLNEYDHDATLEAALRYRGQGCSVIPLVPRNKRAAIEWKAYQVKVANDNQLIDWFANEDRNIGIVTGAVSQIVVLDVDHPEALAHYPELPKTVSVKTGREGGGRHYYFNAPAGFDISNFPIEGLGDLKANGGYVVAPPSIHDKTGKPYVWEGEIGKDSVADLPDWLLALATRKRMPTPEQLDDVKTTAYGKRWYDDVVELANAREGGRNNLLNTVAAKAGSLIAARQLNKAEAWKALEDACRKNGLAADRFSGGMLGVVQTIRSGMRIGENNPRHPMKAEATVPVFSGGKLQLRRMSDVGVEKIDWLWPGVLARGHITLISGDPGTGKSQLSLSLAATVSNGGAWPVTGGRVEPGNVIILSREDRAEDTIKPRLMAAGADDSRVFVVGDVDDGADGRDFRLKADMALLAAACRELGSVSLIIIDPVSSYMGDGDINNAGDVRSITNELASLVHDYKASVLMITHNSKGQGSAGAKVTGSHAWLAAARTAFSVTKDDVSEIRTMAPIKANIAKDTDAYSFTVTDATIPSATGGVETSYVVWENYTTKKTADQVMADKRDGPAVAEAIDFLTDLIKSGPMSSDEVHELAKRAGLAERTLNRAKKELNIVSKKSDGKWLWQWPGVLVADHALADFKPPM